MLSILIGSIRVCCLCGDGSVFGCGIYLFDALCLHESISIPVSCTNRKAARRSFKKKLRRSGESGKKLPFSSVLLTGWMLENSRRKKIVADDVLFHTLGMNIVRARVKSGTHQHTSDPRPAIPISSSSIVKNLIGSRIITCLWFASFISNTISLV